jgi:hypothetical protein
LLIPLAFYFIIILLPIKPKPVPTTQFSTGHLHAECIIILHGLYIGFKVGGTAVVGAYLQLFIGNGS